MEFPYHNDPITFAHHRPNIHPASVHEMNMYQRQQQEEQQQQKHEAHIQQQQQLAQQQNSDHNQRNNTALHHQHVNTRAQQMSREHLSGATNQNGHQRHTTNNQQHIKHNQVIRQNNNRSTSSNPQQNRAIGSNPNFHQQRFQPNNATQLHHSIMPPTSVGHNHQLNSNFIRPTFQESDFPLRILVQSDMVGAIIGRSGGTIKQITQHSKARIDVHREESIDQQEKVITINGNPESCSLACFKIIEVILNERMQINQNSSSNNLDNTTDMSQDNNFNQASNSEVQLKILAHNNLIGRLIGRNGASIKKIMEQTSTKINISINCLTDCTNERTITVVGNLEEVRQAEKIISSKLRAAYMSDVSSTLQAINQPYLFNNVPLPYMSGPYTQNPILSTLVNPQANHSGHAMSRAVPLGSHQSQIPGSQMYPSSTNYLSLYPNISASPNGQGLLGFNPTISGLEVERETVNIYIPDSMVGAIIGKSGSAIKEMISLSGASIKVAAAASTQSTNTSKEEEVQPPLQSQQVSPQSTNVSKTETGVADPNTESRSNSVTNPQQTISRQHSTENCLPTRKVTIVGSPESQYSAQYFIYRKISIENGKSDTSLMVEIQVPSQVVGKIIGKGGVTVKNIQKQTRTSIRLPDEKPNSNEINGDSETSVQISGEFQCSQLAQRHIKSLIRESNYSFNRQNKSHHGKQTETITSKSNAQSNPLDNHQKNNEETSSLPGDVCDELSGRSNGKSIDVSQNDDNPSNGGDTGNGDGSHLSSQNSPVEGAEKVDDNIISNNNTINNNLNSSEVLEAQKDGCQNESGEGVINSTSGIKQKPVIESSENEPAFVNNGDQK